MISRGGGGGGSRGAYVYRGGYSRGEKIHPAAAPTLGQLKVVEARWQAARDHGLCARMDARRAARKLAFSKLLATRLASDCAVPWLPVELIEMVGAFQPTALPPAAALVQLVARGVRSNNDIRWAPIRPFQWAPIYDDVVGRGGGRGGTCNDSGARLKSGSNMMTQFCAAMCAADLPPEVCYNIRTDELAKTICHSFCGWVKGECFEGITIAAGDSSAVAARSRALIESVDCLCRSLDFARWQQLSKQKLAAAAAQERLKVQREHVRRNRCCSCLLRHFDGNKI
eukprot:SAG22_NODE_1364_length_4611_cov_3.558732_2_plen_284_part_00